MDIWQPMSSAPRDGTWFLLLRPCTIVGGGPARIKPELDVIRRLRSSPESDGYWSNIYGHSIADSYIGKHSRWSTFDALPLVEIWQGIEAERIRNGGTPQPLPVPLEQPAEDTPNV